MVKEPKLLSGCKFIAEVPAGYVVKWFDGTFVAASPKGPALILKDGEWEELKPIRGGCRCRSC